MSTLDLPPLAGHEPESLAEQAYLQLRAKIVRLDFAPGHVLREDALRETLGLGRTPIREALLRLQREHFVTVIPRRGMFVSGIEVDELALLFETRAVLEPYAARLATRRGTTADWDEMAATLARSDEPGIDDEDHLAIDRRCHEIIWAAAKNRFLWDTLDMLYAQSDRLWHLYLSDVADMRHAVDEHEAILTALRAEDADSAADLVERHVQGFDETIRNAVASQLSPT